MERKIYYGTARSLGHNPHPIEYPDYDPKQDDAIWNGLDSENWMNIINTYGPYITDMVFKCMDWTVYAIPYSVDDDRPGCHSSFWWEGGHSKEEMLEYIKNNDFLKRQLDYDHIKR